MLLERGREDPSSVDDIETGVNIKNYFMLLYRKREILKVLLRGKASLKKCANRVRAFRILVSMSGAFFR